MMIKPEFMRSVDIDSCEIAATYVRVHLFFDAFSLNLSLVFAESALMAAASQGFWKYEAPGSLLYFMKNLQRLVSAAFILHLESCEEDEVIEARPEKGVPNILDTATYVGTGSRSHPWSHFPRNLTCGQFHNPYKALQRFCNYFPENKWKCVLEELTEFALNKGSITEAFPDYNLLVIRKRLLSLLEACHLIHVRSKGSTPS